MSLIAIFMPNPRTNPFFWFYSSLDVDNRWEGKEKLL